MATPQVGFNPSQDPTGYRKFQELITQYANTARDNALAQQYGKLVNDPNVIPQPQVQPQGNQTDIIPNLAAGVGKLEQTPQNIALGSEGGRIASALGSLGKSFAEGYAATQPKPEDELRAATIAKLNAETAAISPEVTLDKMKKEKTKFLGDQKKDFEANADIKDEVSRAQATEQIKKIIADPNQLNNRESMGTLRKLIGVVVRPEIKRTTPEASQNLGTVAGLIGGAAGQGLKNLDEVINDLIRGGGVLDPGTASEILNIVSHFEEPSKANFAKAAASYRYLMQEAGATDEDINKLLPVPNGYSFDYVAPEKENIPPVITSGTTKENIPPKTVKPMDKTKPFTVPDTGVTLIFDAKLNKWVAK